MRAHCPGERSLTITRERSRDAVRTVLPFVRTDRVLGVDRTPPPRVKRACSLQREEFFANRRGDVDFSEGVIHVRFQLSRQDK